MDGFVGIIVFFVIASVVSSIFKAAGKTNQQNNGSLGSGRSSSGAAGSTRTGAYTGSATSEQRARLEQLRRLQQQRQAAGPSAAGSAKNTYAEKPIVPHSNEDCTGGSIHDGYHEGTARLPKPASSAEGRLGRQGVLAKEGLGASDLYRKEWEQKLAEKIKPAAASEVKPQAQAQAQSNIGTVQSVREPSGAERLSKAIEGKPAIVQGLIWSEVLSRPLSDA